MEKLTCDDNQFNIQILPQETIPKNVSKISSASLLFNQIPSLIGAHELSQSYKIVFPPGASGTLMNLKKGLLGGLKTTNIMNESHQITGSAGLISNLRLPQAMQIFSVMSMITGQYFMAQINQSLSKISESLEEIKRQNDASEESVVFSASIFLQTIKNDWNLILDSEDFKISIISNVIKIINDLTASCYYFENRLNTKMSELKTVLKKNRIADATLRCELSRNKDFLILGYEIRSCLKMMLIILTTIITKNNAEEIKNNLKKDDELIFSSTVKQLELNIDLIVDLLTKAPNEKLQKQAYEVKPIVKSIREITRDRYSNSVKKNIEATIDKLKVIDENGLNLFVSGDQLYIEEAA